MTFNLSSEREALQVIFLSIFTNPIMILSIFYRLQNLFVNGNPSTKPLNVVLYIF